MIVFGRAKVKQDEYVLIKLMKISKEEKMKKADALFVEYRALKIIKLCSLHIS